MTLGKAQTGSRSSTPKITKISADDNMKLMYKNMGNNHTVPFMWADSVTLVSGTTEIVVASGVKFHGWDLATSGNVTVTAVGDPGGYLYVDKNTVTNVVKVVTSSAPAADCVIDVKYMMGDASTARYIEDMFCRGNTGASASLP